MNDRELLELAAKAAGYELGYVEGCDDVRKSPDWNPLTDDGDALRLAVKLRMDIRFYPDGETPWVETAADSGDADEALTTDPFAATRRAIVRAAAEIGECIRPFPTAEEIREEWT